MRMMILWRRAAAVVGGAVVGFGALALALAFALGLSLVLAAGAEAAWQTGMQEPASAIAREQQWLNLFMLGVITVIGIGVFGAMFYAVFKHRKDKGHAAANFHENTMVEVIWTAVPMLIIILMALPATRVILAYKDTSAPDITIKVTGYQWKWSYDYLDEGVSFYSQLSTPPEQIGGKYYSVADAEATPKGDNYLLEVDNEMVVPVGKKVRLLLTAADVIHAWWVPQLGVKQDAIPGFVRDAWFRADRPGVYRGQCAELCGKNHGFMPIVVRAVSEADYADWLAEQGAGDDATSGEPLRVADAAASASSEQASAEVAGEWTMESAMELGEQQYAKFCAACHQANGEGLPPAFPGLVGGISADAGKLGEHLDIVLNGKSGTSMASFSYLSDADIAAIITYERNAWGHNTGQLVTPEEVKAAR